MISRDQAFALYGGSASKLAEALGYTSRHAVYMWPKEGPIPELAYLKLRYELKPEAFDRAGRIRTARRRAIVAKKRKPFPRRVVHTGRAR